MEEKPQKNIALWFPPGSFFHYFSHIAEDHLPVDSNTNSGLDYIASIKNPKNDQET